MNLAFREEHNLQEDLFLKKKCNFNLSLETVLLWHQTGRDGGVMFSHFVAIKGVKGY